MADAASSQDEAEGHVQPPSCAVRSEEHTSELQSHSDLVCRLLLEKKKPHRARFGVRRLLREEGTGLRSLPVSVAITDCQVLRLRTLRRGTERRLHARAAVTTMLGI